MRTFSYRTCGLLLSFMTLGGCALLDPPASDGGSAETASETIAPLEKQVAAAEEDAFTTADFEAIQNPDRETIRSVQAALNAVGFPVGQPDGRIGKNTLHGMRLFKVARRMPVDNSITPALLTALKVQRN